MNDAQSFSWNCSLSFAILPNATKSAALDFTVKARGRPFHLSANLSANKSLGKWGPHRTFDFKPMH